MMLLLQKLLLLLSSLCVIRQVSCQRSSSSDYIRQRLPNPLKEALVCGRERVERSFICDPDGILQSMEIEANQLDRLIGQIINETSCPCSAYSCDKHREGYRIGIALIKKMEFDDGAGSDDEDLDVFEARKRTVVRNLHQAQLYAHEIHKKWMLGRCDEDVIIFFSKEDNVVYTATGDVARMKLTNEIVATVAREARRTGFYKSPFDGLYKIVNDYRSVFLNSYHPRIQPRAEGQTSNSFGVSSVGGGASVTLTCSVILLSIIGGMK